MVKQFILLKQFTQSSNKGFTLIELLVTLVIASIITGSALKLIVDQRQLFLNSQSRTQVNQNLRASLDLVGNDIKQAGERLTTSALPVVRVINGASNASDELVLQRLVIDQSLPVCQTVTSGTTTSTIVVSSKAIASGICSFSDGNANTLPDNLDQWKNSRCNIVPVTNPNCTRTTIIDRATTSNRCDEEKDGGDKECLWAYIYDPVNKVGEFFVYGFESPRDTTNTANNIYRVHRVDGGTWQNTYTYGAVSATNPILYILEQRRYQLVANGTPGTTDKVLRLTINDQTSPNFLVDGQTSPIRLVNQLDNFQVQALMQDGTSKANGFNHTVPPSDNWKLLKAIKIDVKAINPAPNSTKDPILTVSAQFFPRNVSSK